MKTIKERRNEAWAKCNEVTRVEYAKYLEATQVARDECFATLARIDADCDLLLSQTKNPLSGA